MYLFSFRIKFVSDQWQILNFIGIVLFCFIFRRDHLSLVDDPLVFIKCFYIIKYVTNYIVKCSIHKGQLRSSILPIYINCDFVNFNIIKQTKNGHSEGTFDPEVFNRS